MQFDFFKQNEHLNLLTQTKSPVDLYTLDADYYKEIIVNSRIFFDYFVSNRSNVKSLNVVPSVCTHRHLCTPQYNYLGIRYDLYNQKDEIFYKIKFSPYFNESLNRVEFNLGIVFNNPADVSSMKKYKRFMEYFVLTKHTSLSPSHLYIYKLTNSFFSEGLDNSNPYYNTDIAELNKYARLVNNKIPEAQFCFNSDGIFSHNKTVKLRTILEKTKDIPFYHTSSYIFSH